MPIDRIKTSMSGLDVVCHYCIFKASFFVQRHGMLMPLCEHCAVCLPEYETAGVLVSFSVGYPLWLIEQIHGT